MGTFLSKDDVIFFMYFDLLQAFEAKHGHIHVPKDDRLYEWICKIEAHSHKLEDWKKDFLKEVGFILPQYSTQMTA